jgi:hypothetical protein
MAKHINVHFLLQNINKTRLESHYYTTAIIMNVIYDDQGDLTPLEEGIVT